MANHYQLIDSGREKKLEKFGPYVIARPCAQAVWEQTLSPEVWKKADASFTREEENRWHKQKPLKTPWTISVDSLKFQLSLTDFGHLGIFPEQRPFWGWIKQTIEKSEKKDLTLLNLFAYSGGVTLAAAQAGAQVCHLDASKKMVQWAKDNALLNGLENAPIRWIVDDALKFLKREVKRGRHYDAIVLDPPTFGRGAKGEVFKIEKQLPLLLTLCKELLTPNPLFLLLSCHTPGYTPLMMQHLLTQAMQNLNGSIDTGEMIIKSTTSLALPSGTYARWRSSSLE